MRHEAGRSRAIVPAFRELEIIFICRGMYGSEENFLLRKSVEAI